VPEEALNPSFAARASRLWARRGVANARHGQSHGCALRLALHPTARRAHSRGRVPSFLRFFGFLLLAWAFAAQADDLDNRVERLAQELRCVVCQSQSVAESNAPLAIDMKRQLREGLAAGRSEAELKAELVQRYGEQVLYRPALHAGTAPLWFGPLVLLAVGVVVYLRQRGGPR